VLIDNRLHREQAGYHVITPLRLAGSEMHVLVNRGWVAAPADHKIIPAAEVPAGTIELTGIAVVPGQRFFNLAPQPTSGWDAVWQNLDLARFRSAVPYPIQPVVVQLDPGAAGGYVREWPRPDERAERHRSYALQWFGFALASVAIWIYFLVRRP
jgi:surfeit locus 1 family protein